MWPQELMMQSLCGLDKIIRQMFFHTRPQLGKAIFKSSLSLMDQGHLLPLQHIFTKTEWHLERLVHLTVNNLLGMIEELQAEMLWLYDNTFPEIISSLQHILCSSLLYIGLTGNNITSTEAVCRLQAPKLRSIYLNRNQIISFDTLKKAYFPCLLEIYVDQNPFSELEGLPEVLLRDLQTLYLQKPHKKKHRREPERFAKVNVLLKMMCGSIDFIFLQPSSLRSAAIKMLKQKCQPRLNKWE